MIGSESHWNTVRETKRYAGHTEKVSGLNELKNLATREKLGVWGKFNTRKLSNSSLFMEFRKGAYV